MNYEKKYKEALERASKLKVQNPFDTVGQMVEHIFPELKESEDKRMLREIKRYIQEQGDKPTGLPNGTVPVSDMITWLEKQGENKPTDKIEPKFKVGDWITNNACIIQITSVDDKYYWHDNDCIGGDIESIDKQYHLWAIEDAKDGDVLIKEETGELFIHNGNRGTYLPEFLGAYCGIDNGEFKPNGSPYYWGIPTCPATKKQRDLLFSKMKEAGYEWDADKKELKKMEVVSKESEDERIRKGLIKAVSRIFEGYKLFDTDVTREEALAWLEKQSNKSINIDVESMVSSYEQRVVSQYNGVRNNPLVNMCLTSFRHGVENVLEELNLKKLEKQGESED